MKSHAVPPTTNPDAACSAVNSATPFFAMTVNHAVAGLGGVLRRLADQLGIEPRRDDAVEHVLDDGVRLRDDADPSSRGRATSRAMTCEPT